MCPLQEKAASCVANSKTVSNAALAVLSGIGAAAWRTELGEDGATAGGGTTLRYNAAVGSLYDALAAVDGVARAKVWPPSLTRTNPPRAPPSHHLARSPARQQHPPTRRVVSPVSLPVSQVENLLKTLRKGVYKGLPTTPSDVVGDERNTSAILRLDKNGWEVVG